MSTYQQYFNFLDPIKFQELFFYVYENQSSFVPSTVVNEETTGKLNNAYRRSNIVYQFEPLQSLFQEKILTIYDEQFAGKYGKCKKIEIQLTRSGDGDFFKIHPDNNGEAGTRDRRMTFVYYFHVEPRQFSGGNLLLYLNGRDSAPTTIPPINNMLIMFESHLWHEVTLVKLPDNLWIGGRFTVNGWINV